MPIVKCISDKIKINRALTEFKGNALIVGCGYSKSHNFSFLSQSVSSVALHPAKTFYHLSLAVDYSDEGFHDIEGDFLDEEVIHYLASKQFNLICFEVVTELFSSSSNSRKAMKHVKSLLSKDGLCFIFGGGRNSNVMQEVISNFNYAYSFTYGISNTWSVLLSDVPIDLIAVMKKFPYLDYMGNQVIKTKSNLKIEFHYKECALNRHVNYSDKGDLLLLEIINPFAKIKGLEIQKKIAEMLSDSDDEGIYNGCSPY